MKLGKDEVPFLRKRTCSIFMTPSNHKNIMRMGDPEMDMSDIIKTLAQEKTTILQGDAERIARQHGEGKCTARERVTKLFDAGSFVEVDTLRADSNLVAAYGTVNGCAAYCFAQDFASCGGAMTKEQAEKIQKLLNMAKLTGAPVVAMLDSAGVKLSDGAAALPLYAKVMNQLARLSGVCPIIAVVMGPVRGLATLLTQVADVTIQVKKTGEVALHTALVMNSEKGVEKSTQSLFGADVMAKQGVCALTAETEDEAEAMVSALIDLLPANNMESAPLVDDDDLNRLMAGDNAEDAAALMADAADLGHVVELYAAYGKSIRTALCRIGGRTCGLVVSDHQNDNGRLHVEDCKKAARFVRLCDCYSLPVVSFVNADGIAVPCECKQGDMIRAAADLCYAYAECTAPKVGIICGNAVGAAYVAMGGKDMADVSYAWPTAMIAPLTEEVAVQVLNEKEMLEGEKKEDLMAAYRDSCGALFAARNGLVDDVIVPQETRKYIIAALEMLVSKHDVNLPRKHGNLPL